MALKTNTLLVSLVLGASMVISTLIYVNSKSSASVNEDKLEPSSSVVSKEESKVPECDFGHCPVYNVGDTDGDGEWESIVEVPGAMNKGAGSIWIIDEGKVVFESGIGAGIGYNIPEDEAGINIGYISEYDEAGLEPKTIAEEKWRYENGSYVLKNTVEREWK